MRLRRNLRTFSSTVLRYPTLMVLEGKLRLFGVLKNHGCSFVSFSTQSTNSVTSAKPEFLITKRSNMVCHRPSAIPICRKLVDSICVSLSSSILVFRQTLSKFPLSVISKIRLFFLLPISYNPKAGITSPTGTFVSIKNDSSRAL